MANEKFMWAHLVHLGSNMWNEEGNTKGREHRSTPCASPKLLFNRECWDAHMLELKACGVNTLIVDVGDAMLYESHPEIALEGSWDKNTMKAEIDKLTAMGFELVPKINFSSCHDIWLKDYSRMLSTPTYYKVCKDIIDEVCEVFKPKYLHLGMDEETYKHQVNFNYAVVRHGDLWWHDFYYLVDCVEKNGVQAWIWSDYIWNHEELFLEKMPKSVIQSNWYYGMQFDPATRSENHNTRLRAFETLDKHGFLQVPTGSVFSALENFEQLAAFCKERISKENLIGMMQTTWERIDPNWMHVHQAVPDTFQKAQKIFE